MAEKHACQLEGTAFDSRTLIDSGNLPFKAFAHRFSGIGELVSKCTTWPAAWTPESVLPAANVFIFWEDNSCNAFSKVSWTVIALACFCQPEKWDPSYWIINAILSK